MTTNFLRQIREARGMTATYLAKEIGQSIQLISNFENNRVNLSTDVAKKICDFFGITYEYLMTGKVTDDRVSTKLKMEKAFKMVASYYADQHIGNDALFKISTELNWKD